MYTYKLEDQEAQLIQEYRNLPASEQEAIRTAVHELHKAHGIAGLLIRPKNVVPLK